VPLARTGGPRRSTQHALPLDEGCGALALASVVSLARPARACGCFAPPSTLENVVQAGERILFAVRNGTVIAHVQIQYAGQAQNFGWLLPLPSVPTLKLGTDELFTELNRTTVPTYSATTVFACARQASASPLFGCSPTALSRSSGGESQDALQRRAQHREHVAADQIVQGRGANHRGDFAGDVLVTLLRAQLLREVFVDGQSLLRRSHASSLWREALASRDTRHVHPRRWAGPFPSRILRGPCVLSR
jgi:hypothetical protein